MYDLSRFESDLDLITKIQTGTLDEEKYWLINFLGGIQPSEDFYQNPMTA